VVPRGVETVLGTREVRRHRERVVAGLGGTVVEIGFGSGLNVPLYPSSVATVYAVDPSATARRLSQARVAASPVPVHFIGLDGQDLPLPEDSLDAALSTFTLCTIPDVRRALREVRRVLKPDGRFHVLEHGLAQGDTARWQRRLDPLQRRLAGGCHLDRDMRGLLAEAGFDVTGLANDWLRGHKMLRPWAFLYEGVVTKRAEHAPT
jgi:ubiquinone/menaquinone biosynthesis C-methylase UbiE